MLGHAHKWFARHIQAAAYSFSVLRQKPLSTLMTIAVIAVALTLPTLFWIVNDNLKSITSYWHHHAHISLYLKINATPSEMAQAQTAVQRIPGVGQALLKTPEQGLQEFEQEEGMHDVMHYLPLNPLPAVVDIVPAADIETPLKLTQLISRLKSLAFVDQVRLDDSFLQRLYAILTLVKALVQGMMLLLSTAVVLIIGNTLRLVFYHRHEELLVLKLIGARDAYIMRPFSYLGVWYGVLGALGAILFVTVFLYHLSYAAAHFISVYQITYRFIGLTIQQSYLLVIFSGLLGFIASQCFIRTRLASIETLPG